MTPLAFIGGLGMWEVGIIAFVLVLLFGARRIPDLARALGRSLTEFKRGREEDTPPASETTEDNDKSIPTTATGQDQDTKKSTVIP